MIKDIGRVSEGPMQICLKWQVKHKKLVDDVCESKIGDYIETWSHRKNEIFTILPDNFPVSLDVQNILADLEKLRGNHLAFTVGCEPLIKEYCYSASCAIEEGLSEWISKVEKMFELLISVTLTSEELVDESCISAGKLVKGEIDPYLSESMEIFRKRVSDFLNEIHSNPTLLDHNALARKVYEQRVFPIVHIQSISHKPTEVRDFIDEFLKNQEIHVKFMDAHEVKIKTEFYWRERIAVFRDILFVQASQIQSELRKLLIDKVESFSQIQLLRENENQVFKRSIVLKGEEIISQVISALQNFN